MKIFLIHTYDKHGSEDYYIARANNIQEVESSSKELLDEGWRGEVIDISQKLDNRNTNIIHITGQYV